MVNTTRSISIMVSTRLPLGLPFCHQPFKSMNLRWKNIPGLLFWVYYLKPIIAFETVLFGCDKNSNRICDSLKLESESTGIQIGFSIPFFIFNLRCILLKRAKKCCSEHKTMKHMSKLKQKRKSIIITEFTFNQSE